MDTLEHNTRPRRGRDKKIALWLLMGGVFCLPPGSSSGAEIYRWSDRQGEVHYGDEAPAQGDYQPVELPDEGSTQIEQAVDSPTPALSARMVEREKRFELCVNALRRLVHEQRRRLRSETPVGNGSDGLVTSEGVTLGLELEPPVTAAETYWKVGAKGVTFSNARPGPSEAAYQRAIREQCDTGTAVSERQLAAVNALIQEENCQRLRTYYAWAKQSTSSTATQLTPLKQALKQQCG